MTILHAFLSRFPFIQDTCACLVVALLITVAVLVLP